jgi:hypothetical protein
MILQHRKHQFDSNWVITHWSLISESVTNNQYIYCNYQFSGKRKLIYPNVCVWIQVLTLLVSYLPFQGLQKKLLHRAITGIHRRTDCSRVHVAISTWNCSIVLYFDKSNIFLLKISRTVGINALSGPLPKELGNLTNLKSLWDALIILF